MAETDPLVSSLDVESAMESAEAGVVEKESNYSLGVLFALLTAVCNVGMSSCSKLAGKDSITPYTSNLVNSIVGTVAMTVLVLVQKKPFLPNFHAWRSWYFAYGVALWFYMWGTIRSLQLIDLSSWQSLQACLNQALVMIVAAAFLGEAMGMFKLGVLARNVLAIALITKPPFLFGGESTVSLAGLGFLFVQCTGAAFEAAILRHLRDHPTESLLFWGFFANVIYWLPPGASPPQVRVPFLWPTTSQDQMQNDQSMALVLTVLAGLFNAFWYVCAGYGLKQLNAADFFLLLSPISLVLGSFVGLVAFRESIDALACLALGIIASGFAFDYWWESKSVKIQ